MKGKTHAATLARSTDLHARLGKLERFWWKGSEVSRKMAGRALAMKDHRTALVMSTFAIALENAAIHLYGTITDRKALERRLRASRRRK